ncbi:SDR family NAD(P)-dependent oxidoreductase [Mycolicibacterium smegmatis]|uniref:SDR family NAD(P)-dependent oxidoreductase n=1 Tax=Mycolicibacterium smegmatis TaxID=1772 RepID=UPI001302EC16|nr:SDR family NAD(P)-dependent oxidoreductase [Mycolicibacterium smegmatis]
MDRRVVVVTGASSGFGRLSAEALARAGHRVYAGMRDTDGRNAAEVAALDILSLTEELDIRGIEMDVQSQDSVDAAIAHIVQADGHLDVVIHNAGHMVYGPAEAFTPDQLATIYDVNVIGTQRVNRAALPHLRRRSGSLVVWVSSSSCAGGTPPYLGPYFAAKAAMDALAVSYARELARWGVETTIIVPGAFTSGTNHFAHAGTPADHEVIKQYEAGPYAAFGAQLQTAFDGIVPSDADPNTVAAAIVDVVDAPFGTRPFRVHVDPSQDGADVGFAVQDRLKAEMLHRLGLGDLLTPTITATPAPPRNYT